jgi:hypothetical protein
MNKDYFLRLNGFKNNNFLDKYIDLFNDTPEVDFEKHHIIPRSYFKINHLPIDNSKENLRNLTYKNHYLAHYYLTKCTEGTLKKEMLQYFHVMNKKIAMVAFEINSELWHQIRKNDVQNKREYIMSAAENIANWNKDHKERTPEHRRKMSISMKKYWKKFKRENPDRFGYEN